MSATGSAYGWVLPASDRHFPKYLSTAPKVDGRRMYQSQHIQQSLQLCALRRTAIDIGGHVGFWSYYLAAGFLRLEELLDLWEGNPCLVMVKPLS